LASISHNVMFAVDAVGTRNADRVFARDVAERVNKPERPARAHPLMSLYNLAARCTRSMMAIFAITRPHLFAEAKAQVHAAVKQVDKVKAEADAVLRQAQAAKPAAS